jgi:hypothetical protein
MPRAKRTDTLAKIDGEQSIYAVNQDFFVELNPTSTSTDDLAKIQQRLITDADLLAYLSLNHDSIIRDLAIQKIAAVKETAEWQEAEKVRQAQQEQDEQRHQEYLEAMKPLNAMARMRQLMVEKGAQ